MIFRILKSHTDISKHFGLLSLCAVFSISCQTQSDLPVLKSIEIEGNTSLSDSEIIEGLVIEPTSKIPLIGQVRYFDPSILEPDLLRVVRIYEANGIYGTKVTPAKIDETPKEVHITLKVEEGKEVKVKTLNIVGYPTDLPKSDLKVGSVFKEKKYSELKDSLLTNLKNKGYPYAKIKGDVLISAVQGDADLTLTIESGNYYKLGNISLAGNNHIDAERIVHASGLEVGNRYSESDIQDAKQNLFSLGVFATLEIEPVPTEAKDETLPLKITVSESKFQTIKLGGGVGISSQRQEVRGTIKYQHNNFFGGLRRLNAEAKPGMVFLPGFVNTQKRAFAGEFSANFFQPDFLVQHGFDYLGFTTSFRAQRDVELLSTVTTGAVRVGLVWPTNSRSNFEVGYNWEGFSLGNIPREVDAGCRNGEVCYLSYFDQSATFDKRDSFLNPRDGLFAQLKLQETGSLGQFNFFSIAPEVRGYIPLGKSISIASRIELGTIIPQESDEVIPLQKRLFQGGPTGHRGFGLKRLSPYIPYGKGKQFNVGGNSMMLGSAELRIPVTDKLVPILFVDAGDVQSKEFSFDTKELNYAAGPGLRYDTPIGPVRFDVGYRLNTPSRLKNEKRFAFQFNLGDAF